MKTTLCVLTLNEIDSMKIIMPRVDTRVFDQVLVIDGGSTDGTIEWSRAQGYEVYVQKQRGLRQAYLEALPHIRGDVMVTFSPDGNSVPELLPDLVNELKKAMTWSLFPAISARLKVKMTASSPALATGCLPP